MADNRAKEGSSQRKGQDMPQRYLKSEGAIEIGWKHFG